MIYIATVHWKTDKWIDIQLDYLKRHIKGDYHVYAFLNCLEKDHSKKFYYHSTEPIKDHALKLDILAAKIGFDSKDDNDVLIFLDGDAFPISDLENYIYGKIKKHKLLAIQRRENNGDNQPHPSFCVTTIKFWKKIRGNWQCENGWRNLHGELVRDIGGNLLSILKKYDINWYPLLRSNRRNYHPLRFGIYDDLIYHHGAGFRNAMSRLDFILFDQSTKITLNKSPNKYFDRQKSLQRIIKKNNALSNKVYEIIVNNPNFYQKFT